MHAGRRALREISTVVTPDTLLRWYRGLVAKKYDGSEKYGPGCPRIAGEIQRLILDMAGDNQRLGYTRIQGALGCRYLIHDRDPLFTKAFRASLASSGVYPVKLPSRSPNLNAYAERFVRSIKSECLAQVIPLGERHLRRAVRECVDHYHCERNHQGLGNEPIEPEAANSCSNGPVECRERLGGLLRYYRRAA